MTGLRRNLTERIDRLLGIFPVVMLVGARQAGKTTLSRMVRPGWRYFDLENAADYDLITRDYDFFLSGIPPARRHRRSPGRSAAVPATAGRRGRRAA